MDFVKHLETLGLEPGASPEEIRRAFRERSAAWQPECLPDNVAVQRDGARARKELEESYRFLMARYGMDPVDLSEPQPTPATTTAVVPHERAPPKKDRTSPRKSAPPTPHRKIPITRMVLVTAGVFLVAAFVVPAVRSGDFRSMMATWAEQALEFSLAKLSVWFPMPTPPSTPPKVETASRSTPRGSTVESLPQLSKAQVLQRYGEPRQREVGRWTYTGFAILFQDDSIASLLVREPARPN